ncbi:HD domain-containing protein, partial [bacterium]|nr:HD domain-containing protein [bacterium]
LNISLYLYYAAKDIFVFSITVFNKLNFDLSSDKIKFDKYFSDIDKKYKQILDFCLREKDINQMVTLYVNGTSDYHFFLMTICNNFLKDLIKNLYIKPSIGVIFFKEDNKYKVIGNIGEPFLKKEYDNLSFEVGSHKISDFDYFLMGENGFQHTPEMKYIDLSYMKGEYLYLVLYFREPAFLPQDKKEFIKINLREFGKMLTNFGLTGNYKNTIFNRYTVDNELFEIKTLKNDHSKNVSLIIEKIAVNLKMNDKNIRLLKKAALLHDIGKIFMLKSKDPHLHQTIGAMVLNKIAPLQKYAKIISNHHLMGKNVSFENQLLFLSDYIENTLRNNATVNKDYLSEKKLDKKLLKMISDDFIKDIRGEISHE